MSNWIITEEGNAVNLDMATQIIYNNNQVTAYFACPSKEARYGIDCLNIQSFDIEAHALEYIKEITTQAPWSYKTEAHKLAEVLA